MVLMLGLPDGTTETVLEQFALAEQMSDEFRPFFVSDRPEPHPFVRRGYLYEYVPAHSAWLAQGMDGSYAEFLHARLNDIAAAYGADAVVEVPADGHVDYRRLVLASATTLDIRSAGLQAQVEALRQDLEQAQRELEQERQRQRYATQVVAVQQLVEQVTPPGAIFLVISRGDPQLLDCASREGWHFPQTEAGQYAGHHPASADEAVGHLTALQARGASYLVVPESAYWWLDHYAALRAHLAEHARIEAYRHDAAIVFALTGLPARHLPLRLESSSQPRRGRPSPEKRLERLQRSVKALHEEVHELDVLARMRKGVRELLDPEARVLVISKGDERALPFVSRERAAHFPQGADGGYLGYHPEDGAAVLTELGRLHALGFDHLLVPATSLWWLEAYPELAAHLRAHSDELSPPTGEWRLYALDPAAQSQDGP